MHRDNRDNRSPEVWGDVAETATVASGDSTLTNRSSVSYVSKYSELSRTHGSVISDLSWLTGDELPTLESRDLGLTSAPTRWREGDCLIEHMPPCPVRRSSLLVTNCSMRVLSPRRKAPSKPERRQSLVGCGQEQNWNQKSSAGNGVSGPFQMEEGMRWDEEKIPSQDFPSRPVRRCSVVAAPGVADVLPHITPPREGKGQQHWSEREEDPLPASVGAISSRPANPSAFSEHDAILRPESSIARELPPRAASFASLGLDEFVPQEALRPTFPSKQKSSGGLAPVLLAMQMSLEPVSDNCSKENRIELTRGDKRLLRYPSSIDLYHSFSASTVVSKISVESTTSSAKAPMLSLVETRSTEAKCSHDFHSSSSRSFANSESRNHQQRRWAPTA